MAQVQTSTWKPPRPQPEILPVTVAQAAEYMAWFVNRRAYTRQTDRPDEKSGKYFFYQARDRQTKERLALDAQVIRKHLAGEQTIGLYAINPGDAVLQVGCDRRGLRRGLPGSKNA